MRGDDAEDPLEAEGDHKVLKMGRTEPPRYFGAQRTQRTEFWLCMPFEQLHRESFIGRPVIGQNHLYDR